MRLGAEQCTQFEAAEPRHFNISDDDVEFLVDKHPKRVDSVRRDGDISEIGGKKFDHRFTEQFIVIYDQHVLGGGV